jgi:trk system potassium uptake protein TrkA
MYAVIIGGGKVGYYLAKELVEGGHEVVVLERDGARTRIIDEDLGAVTLCGDGCELSVLEESGIARADVAVAATGDDEINLIACQLAKTRFKVPRTIARINNPKNEKIFKQLGVDATVSTTDTILNKIEEMLPSASLVHVAAMRGTNVEIVEITVPAKSPIVGKKLRDVHLPPDAVVALLIRKGEGRVPPADSVFEANDELVVATSIRSEAYVRQIILGE